MPESPFLTSKEKILEELTPEQTKAVTHGKGPLMIVAGAGTGKTKVLTHRIAYLIGEKLAKPSEIIALTFTEKAAQEMEERVDVMVPYGYVDMWIGTFHAFGNRLLQDYALEMGLAPNFKVLDEAQAVVFLRQHLFELPLKYYRPLGDPTRYLSALVKLFSRAKDEDISPDEYLEYALMLEKQAGESSDPAALEEARKQLELAQGYQVYQRLLWENGFLDLADLVYLSLKLLREHPSVLSALHQRINYVLVDEFQDTNYAQFELIKLLASRERNLTVVGDDDQSIYKFRGAAISNILGFREYYPEAEVVVLTDNFRSCQDILDHAHNLIERNGEERLESRLKINKQLVSHTGKGQGATKHLNFDTVSLEADEIAEIIRKKAAKNRYSYSDFAVLVRTNGDAVPFLRALNLKGIPYRFTGNRGLYQREEIILLTALLRALSNQDDNLSMFHLAGSELYQIAPGDLYRCNSRAGTYNLPLSRVFASPGELGLTFQDPDTVNRLKRLMGDLDRFTQLSASCNPGRVLYQFITETGYLRKLSQGEIVDGELKIRNLAKFFNLVELYETISQPMEITVPHFVKYLDLLLEAGDNPGVAQADSDVPAVSILTVHKAKGLEFRVVFITGLASDKFPTRQRKDLLELPDQLIKEFIPRGDFHTQEERRLFYVGMTRAREELYLSWAQDYGGKRLKKISPFILEALNLPRLDIPSIKKSPVEELNRFATPPPQQETWTFAQESPHQIINLSYWQVDDYLTCPLKYKYVHILRVPVMRHHAVIYGSALHAAAQEYNLAKLQGKPVELAQLEERYKSAWSSEGFISRAHEEERFQAGLEAIRLFFREEESRKLIPTLVEKEFSFIMDNIKVKGRWDRMDERPEGAVLIDYKSSAVTSREDADRKTKESLQLGIYALAYFKSQERLPLAVELHFLESGMIGSFKPDEKKIQKTEEQIKQAAQGIRSGDFAPNPQYNACLYCPFNNICLTSK